MPVTATSRILPKDQTAILREFREKLSLKPAQVVV